MATSSISLQASSPHDLETMTMSYIAQGFNVANKTPLQVTLVKRKSFSYFWAVIGFVFCLLPLVIYLIVYALESDQMVTITVVGAQPMANTGQLMPPQPMTASGALGMTQPANYMTAPRSPDGLYWWDGQAWQLVPQTGQLGAAEQQPPQTAPMNQDPPTNPTAY